VLLDEWFCEGYRDALESPVTPGNVRLCIFQRTSFIF
jgi:hypothetical protein